VRLDRLAAKKSVEQVDLFVEARDAFGPGPVIDADDLSIDGSAADAQPDLEPPARGVVDRRRGHREQRRVAKGDRRDEGPDPRPARHDSHRAEQCPGLVGDQAGVLAGHVVRDPEAVEAHRLAAQDPCHQLVEWRGLEEHQAEPEGSRGGDRRFHHRSL
jgi:hypothetical protein